MALSKKEWQVEIDRLNSVIDHITINMDLLEKKINNSYDLIKRSNKDMWEQSKSNYSDLDDVVEALTLLDGINSDKARHSNEVKLLNKLGLLKKSAYFGRIDFKEDQYDDVDRIYIGTSTFDDKDGDILIYDWRAAVCGMFYEQEKGKAGFISPEGEIRGELVLKRQYRIFYREIQSMFESSLKIDDEILQSILSESKDSKMGIIVSSIQKEQNKAIRNENDRIVLVDGPAGSGKTSIALHRIAWLLYRYRETIKPNNVIVYSPNEIFNDYISDVLPELGEENMNMSTFISLARSYLGHGYSFKDKYYQMEGILRHISEKKSNAIKEKGSFDFAHKIEEYVEQLGNGLYRFSDLTYEDKSVGSEDEINHLFFKDYSTHSMALRFEKLRTLLLKRLNYLVVQMRRDYMKIPRMDYERRKKAVFLARTTSLQIREMIDRCTRPDFPAVYYDFLQYAGYEDYAEKFKNNLEQNYINYEDIAPIMLIKALIGYKNRIQNIKHVVVDEVQDYSAVELIVITKLYENSSYTLLGDTNQAINYLTGLDTLDEITIPGAFIVKLTKSYRSTKQISEFCNRILGNDNNYEYVDRNGDEPAVIKTNNDIIEQIKNEINIMKQKKCRSIAVITRTALSADMIYEEIKSDDIRRVNVHDDTYMLGAVVLPSYLSKGLEYDGVILVCRDEDNYKGEKDKKLLYTCCSRALHQLTILYENEKPDFIA
ncbi:MAG: AAA family ATPase [Clostridia bacterium]|nr:AAA family ATPase [Clostridia bacterium]